MKPIHSAETKRTPVLPPEFDNEILLAAASEAVRQALAQHKSRGNPIVVWRDGRGVILPPAEIQG